MTTFLRVIFTFYRCKIYLGYYNQFLIAPKSFDFIFRQKNLLETAEKFLGIEIMSGHYNFVYKVRTGIYVQ